MKICIDARCIDGQPGGVQQVLIGLASGLSQLRMAEQFSFLVYEHDHAWLNPYLSGNTNLLVAAPVRSKFRKRLIERFPILKTSRHFFSKPRQNFILNQGHPTVEKANVELVHFALQMGFKTSIPSVFTPHDLQHLHFPQFFSNDEIQYRNWLYHELCNQAKVITAMTSVGKDDLTLRFGVPLTKIRVVPWAPPTEAYRNLSNENILKVRQKFNLPEKFIYYPAQTYPHKNHVNLLKALDLLNQRGQTYNLVCTGRTTDHFKIIKPLISQLGLTQQVYFLKFVSPETVSALYHLSSLLVFPSLFEGWGLPILEAFIFGVPVACSNIPVLRSVAGEAAIFFDAEDADQIASVIHTCMQNQSLRHTMTDLGKKRVQMFTWKRTARLLLASYREVLNATTLEDEELLAEIPAV